MALKIYTKKIRLSQALKYKNRGERKAPCLDAWGAWGLKKSRFESVKKAGVNACEKQTSAVQDLLEAGGL